MERPAENLKTVQFGLFQVDLLARELRKSGVKIKLHDQPFQVLTVLLERPGQIVTRGELHSRLWPSDTFVDFDLSLNSAVKKLRHALGDESDNPRFVETLYRRGYRFIAPVVGVPPQNGGSVDTRSAPSEETAGRTPINVLRLRSRRRPRSDVVFGWRLGRSLCSCLPPCSIHGCHGRPRACCGLLRSPAVVTSTR